MDEDLQNQLDLIRELDPDHAILLLADTTEFSFEMLEPDSTEVESLITTVLIPVVIPEARDSTAADSLSETVADTLSLPADTVVILPDTIVEFVPDTIAESVPDTVVELMPDTLTEAASDDSAAVEPTVPEELPEPVETEIEADNTSTNGEEDFEPDTLIQP